VSERESAREREREREGGKDLSAGLGRGKMGRYTGISYQKRVDTARRGHRGPSFRQSSSARRPISLD
jgi:hypothetical protein